MEAKRAWTADSNNQLGRAAMPPRTRRKKSSTSAAPAIGKRPGRAAASSPAFLNYALLLSFLSGAAALIHESLWTRRLVDLLGASAPSTSRVFSCFFLGLSLGAAYAAKRVGRTSYPWRTAGRCELAVAALSLAVWSLPAWSDWIWPALGPERMLGAWGGVAKWLLSAPLIALPAFFMGVVLPMIAAGASSGDDDGAQRCVWLYFFNTLGGVVGLVAAMAILLPMLGAGGAMLVAAGVNVLVGACCLAIGRRTAAELKSPDRAAQIRRPHLVLLFVAWWSGFGVLACEVAGAQLIGLFLPMTHYAPGITLLVVLAMLALSSWFVARSSVVAANLKTPLVVAGVLIAATPLAFQAAVKAFDPGPSANLLLFLAKSALFASFVLGPMMLAAGMVFPKCIRQLSAADDSRSGGDARLLGWLLAFNGVGGFVGAEIANRWMIPAFGVHTTVGVVGTLYVAIAVILLLPVPGLRSRTVIAPAAIAASLTAVTLFATARLPHINPHLGFRLVEEFFGRDGPVAVVEHERIGRAILMSNQYVLGGTNVRYDQERQAHLPLILHPHPQDVAFIGVATGITPGAVLEHAGLNATAIELSPQVLEAATRHFGEFNHGVADSSVQIVVEDGRTYLASCADQFDVVVGDLFLPWGPGEGRLFSLEHFQAVRRSLKPGGLFCQWLPMYQLTPDQFEVIAETFQQAFGKVYLFRGTLGVKSPTLALVGLRDAELDWNRIRQRCAAVQQAGRVLDPSMRSADGLAMLYLGEFAADKPRPRLNTLNNLAIELSASNQRITGAPGRKYLQGAMWLEYLQQRLHHRTSDIRTSADLAAMRQLGWKVSLWERAVETHDARSSLLKQEILKEMPPELRADAAAHVERWPSDVRLFARQ